MRNQNTDDNDIFKLLKRIIIKDIPEFNKISMQFCFKNTKNGREVTSLIFAKQERLMEINFLTEKITDVVIFDVPLSRQPEFFLMNDDQTVSIIASMDDGIYYNHRTRVFVDLDELFSISNIKEIIHDHEEKVFYMLANKYHQRLGMFLVKFDENKPDSHKFVIKWKNKLDIADADVNIVRNTKKQFKELVVSFKTIYMNTYNVQVIDISTDTEKLLFRHESF